ncbi:MULTISPECIES: gamma-glutamyl-gamma-aminobutyrate hydrolase family protein [Streptomyces]|jgi:putative glutamine amidotransferase|uniref:Gamma-glutamyl-gamma-aminobutyrate hydrolase family protein n=1 Tax=Streptomyces edwardsiae TaxID=3075527 RepID=A0ABU2PY12_9ACTN|nr:gamma-glutamyl-gamma-aminobutyrate hydrolase family protein [Streptomyces sp. DSM 41636]MDT0397061.1 gamma-glutamyl-gamma-aminobutyrate hydrolase family protein [Streptomyces sp. DSM 41636]
MTARPLIGISTYAEPEVSWGAWRLDAALLPAGYPRLVQRAGGLAAMLPPDAPEHAAATVARLDGLVIAGGPDVEPVHYGAEPDPRTGPPDRARDAWELALIKAALAQGVPLLGICRGMQLLNVALGGTLTQHIDGHATAPGTFTHHSIKPVPGTLYAAASPAQISVPTHHHQSVDRLGKDLSPSAHAEDGTVEAIELPPPTWTLGIQWHPEMSNDLSIMRSLVGSIRGQSCRWDGTGGRDGTP